MKMLNQNMTTTEHLTEDQLDDHLIGDLSAEATAHLAACAHCTARVDQMLSPIASFQTVSLAWSERVSATAPMPPISVGQPLWERRMAWSLALATCAVGIGLVGIGHRLMPSHQPTASVATTHTVAAATPSADEIARDNQLLNTIDTELNTSAESPSALGLVPVSATAPRRAANPAFQD